MIYIYRVKIELFIFYINLFYFILFNYSLLNIRIKNKILLYTKKFNKSNY